MRIKNRLKTKKRILGFLLTPLCLVNLFGIGFATFSFPKTAGIDGVNGGVGEIISSLDFISLDRIETSITCPTGFVFNEEINERYFYVDIFYKVDLPNFIKLTSNNNFVNKKINASFDISNANNPPYNIFQSSVSNTISSKYSLDGGVNFPYTSCQYETVGTNTSSNNIKLRDGSYWILTNDYFNSASTLHLKTSFVFDFQNIKYSSIYNSWKNNESINGGKLSLAFSILMEVQDYEA